MNCKDHRAWGQAHEKYPYLWIEKILEKNVLAMSIGAIPMAIQGYFGIVTKSISLMPKWWVSALAVSLYVVGRFVDAYSTIRVFKLKSYFDERGKDFPIVEKNKLLPEYPTAKELVFSVTTLFELLGMGITVFIPGMGIGLGVNALALGYHNNRNRLRLAEVVKSWEG